MTARVLLLPAVLALAAAVQAQGDLDWIAICNNDPSEAVRGATPWPYQRDLGAAGCAWNRTDGGTRVVVTEDQRRRIAVDMTAATRWFAENGFRDPKLSGDLWRVTLYPGRYPCTPTGCDDDPVYGVYREFAAGGEVSVATAYFTDPDARSTAYHEMSHAVISAYPASGRGRGECGDPCWIGEGLAEAFGQWWAGGRAAPSSLPVLRRYDVPLPTGSSEYALGQNTWPFWASVIQQTGGFVFARHVLEAASFEDVGAVDQALRRAGLEGGLAQAYVGFAGAALSDNDRGFQTVFALEPADGVPAHHDIFQDPISTLAFEVSFPEPRHLSTLTVRLAGESGDPRLLVGGLEVGDEYTTTTADVCENGRCRLPVRVVNVADDAGESGPASYRIEADLEDGACAFRLPEGITGLHYRMDGEETRMLLRLDLEASGRGGRRVLSGPVHATMMIRADETWTTTRARVTIRCTPSGLDVSGITEAFSQWQQGADPSRRRTDAQMSSSGLVLPARPTPGLALEDLESDIAIQIEGTEGMRASSRVTNRRVVGEHAYSSGGRDRRLDGARAWVIEGESSGSMALESQVVEDEMERAGVDLDDDYGRRVREQMRDLFGSLNASLSQGMDESVPYRVWYSLDYGLMRVDVDGAPSLRLYQLYPEE